MKIGITQFKSQLDCDKSTLLRTKTYEQNFLHVCSSY